MNVLGSSLYVSIITNLFDALACDYESDPWTTYTASGLTCWEGLHFLYVGCSLLGIVIYYPMSTFMYPNLQFQNKSLDLKFYPSFLIVMSQIMLFVSGLDCFYSTEPSVALSFIAVSMLVMGLVCLKTKPCLVKKTNLWYAVKYLLIAWVRSAVHPEIDMRGRRNNESDRRGETLHRLHRVRRWDDYSPSLRGKSDSVSRQRDLCLFQPLLQGKRVRCS